MLRTDGRGVLSSPFLAMDARGEDVAVQGVLPVGCLPQQGRARGQRMEAKHAPLRDGLGVPRLRHVGIPPTVPEYRSSSAIIQEHRDPPTETGHRIFDDGICWSGVDAWEMGGGLVDFHRYA